MFGQYMKLNQCMGVSVCGVASSALHSWMHVRQICICICNGIRTYTFTCKFISVSASLNLAPSVCVHMHLYMSVDDEWIEHDKTSLACG